MLKDRDNLDEYQGFIEIANHERVTVNGLDHGSILIWVSPDNLQYLDIFLRQKSHEIWLELRQMEGDIIK